MITTQSPILGSGGTLREAMAWALDEHDAYPPHAVEDYLRELHRLCALTGIDYRIAVAQWAHETANGTSHWWRTRLNPAGIGVTGDPKQDAESPTFKSGAEAAQAHCVHMWAYLGHAFVGSPLVKYWDLDPRYEAVCDAGFRGSVTVLGDLGNGRWATDPRYAEKIAERANQIFKEASMPQTTPFPLGMGFAVDLLKPGAPNNPNRDLAPNVEWWITWHDTANYAAAADAEMHKTFVLNGGGSERVSFHFAVDDHEAWQMMAVTKVGWHAGDYCDEYPDGRGHDDIGCFGSIAIETCVNAGSDWTKTKRNLAMLTAMIVASDERVAGMAGAKGRFSLDRIALHQKWSGKYCSRKILDEGSFEQIRAMARVFHGQMTQTTPAPSKPTASPIWWTPGDIGVQKREHDGALALAMLGEVTAKRSVPVRKDANSKSPIIGRIEQGKTAKIVGTHRNTNRWVFVEMAPDVYGRALWSAFAERYPTL